MNAVASKVAKSNIAQECEQTFLIPLASVTKNLNPREEPANLCRIGYSLLDPEDTEHSLLAMCISDDVETQRAAVELFEEHESEEYFGGESPRADLSNVTGHKENGGTRQSICSLAASINDAGQLEPSAVKRGGKRNDGGHNYTLIFGQRRVSAIAYAHAANCVAKADGEELPFPEIMPVFKANEISVNDDEAFDLAVRENMDRKNFDPIQEGYMYLEFTRRKNPETGKRWNLKDIAQHVDRPYGHVRNRHSLAVPYKADKLDEKGNVVKKGKGLTEEQRDALRQGKKTLTWAIHTSLREDHYSDGARQTTRDKAIPLGEMKNLFDETPGDKDQVNVARRTAIAECMGKTLAQAKKESKKRIKEAAEKEQRAADKAAEKAAKEETASEAA